MWFANSGSLKLHHAMQMVWRKNENILKLQAFFNPHFNPYCFLSVLVCSWMVTYKPK